MLRRVYLGEEQGRFLGSEMNFRARGAGKMVASPAFTDPSVGHPLSTNLTSEDFAQIRSGKKACAVQGTLVSTHFS